MNAFLWLIIATDVASIGAILYLVNTISVLKAANEDLEDKAAKYYLRLLGQASDKDA